MLFHWFHSLNPSKKIKKIKKTKKTLLSSRQDLGKSSPIRTQLWYANANANANYECASVWVCVPPDRIWANPLRAGFNYDMQMQIMNVHLCECVCVCVGVSGWESLAGSHCHGFRFLSAACFPSPTHQNC